MTNDKDQLTSVNVDKNDFNEFKRVSLGTGTNLKKLVEFALKSYLVDVEFKTRVDKHTPGGNVSAEQK
jgi:hypothetical protein